MLTREAVSHNCQPVQPRQVVTPGFVRVVMYKNIPQTWAVVRPGSSPDPNGAPYYLGFASRLNDITYGGTLGLVLRQPKLEMDPSDPTTWQRKYVFS